MPRRGVATPPTLRRSRGRDRPRLAGRRLLAGPGPSSFHHRGPPCEIGPFPPAWRRGTGP